MGLEEYWSVRIIAITAVIFVLQMVFPWITDSFALNSSSLSKPWEFVTHMFLHGGFEHIFYNMFALGLFGIILEKLIGGRRFLMIYFAGGVIAGIGAFLFYPSAIGASGAVFAVMGTLVVLRPKLTVFVFGIPMPMIVASAVWIAIDIFGVFFPAGTANTAHLAGLFFGFVVGFLIRKQFGEPLFSEKRKQAFTDREFNSWENRWMH